MNIFYFGADYTWGEMQKKGFRRRNTCILKALAENDSVNKIFVVRKVTLQTFVGWLISKRTEYRKVDDICYASFLPNSLLEKTGMLNLNKKINAFILRRIAGVNTENDLLWAYWPQGFLEADDSGLKGKLIFDTDHNIICDPNLEEKDFNPRKNLLILAGIKSTWILSSAVSMIGWYNVNGYTNTYRLRNGIDSGRFMKNYNSKNDNRFTVGYCGTLSTWIDYDLFEIIIQRNPQWRFVIIGSGYLNDTWQILNKYDNVELMGDKIADEVAKIIPGFDAAISLYRKHPALDVDSMKLYEYLAAGVPVVSTRFHEKLSEDFDNLIDVAESSEDFEDKLKSIEQRKPCREGKIIAFLRNSSWNSRINEFLKYISQKKAT